GSSNFYSEAPIIVENGVRKSPQLTVHFDNKVFDLRGGGSTASLNDMNATYSNIVNYFTQLEQKYGMIKFRKQIPSAEWGDVERRNLRTGQLP
ncbi:MAG: hypothetical protein GWN00_02155, partial [Aliifodinibius sp.]|nr:hypothetical protein [Fodinibius sp.]NIW43456.1 hypothetical protein [Gammaproteobacteria bacterium]NIY23660.1 hypothetical protein [Fodinibius sp.]